MAFNPQVTSWIYQKDSGIIPSTTLSLDPELPATSSNIEVINKPSWLNVNLDTFEKDDRYDNIIGLFNFKISVNRIYANVLTQGDYVGKIKIRYSWAFGKSSEEFTVNLQVRDSVKLSLNQTIFTFKHNVGDPPPDMRFLGITTTRNWTVTSDVPWIKTTVPSGAGNASLGIFVDLASATGGTFLSGKLLVDDGNSTQSVTVFLLIRGAVINNDVQDLSPDNLSFTGKLGAVSPSPKEISITNTQLINVTSDVAWLSFSETQFFAGTHTLTVSLTNANTLPVGSYPANITLTSDYATDVINVLLRIIENTSKGISSNSFLFAKDRNALVLTNEIEDSEAYIEFETQGTRDLKKYIKRIPFYQGVATTIVGLEADVFLFPESIPELSSIIYEPVKPMVIAMKVFDKTLEDFAKTERVAYQNIKVIKGKTPAKQDKLCYIPTLVTLPQDGILAFSFKTSENTPLADIEITGSITSNSTPPFNDSGIYTVLIKVADYNLTPGQRIQITGPANNFTARISDTVAESVQLIWLNEWDIPEVFNLTGTLVIAADDDSETVSLSREGKVYTTIIDVKDAESFNINTGNIHSEAEARWLGSVLRSKKMWLQIGSQRVEVIRTFRSLEISKSRRFSRSYDLTFDAAER